MFPMCTVEVNGSMTRVSALSLTKYTYFRQRVPAVAFNATCAICRFRDERSQHDCSMLDFKENFVLLALDF